MKLVNKFLLPLFAIVCLTCCDTTFELSFANFGIEYTNESVDTKSLDDYFLSNEEKYPSYKKLKSNQPDLLNHTKYVKSDHVISKRKVQIIRFSSQDNGGMNNMTFLRFNNDYYPLGGSFGGWGVTEFLYQKNNEHSWLYFIFSMGSGIHRSYIDAVDLSKGTYYSIIGIETADAFIDYTFELDEENNIDLYEADIYHEYDKDGFDLFSISKKRLAIDDINNMELHPID